MKNEAFGVELSVVVPVCGEEGVLTELFDRLYPVLDGLGMAYEVVFVDGGSRDRSMTLLRQQYKLRPEVTRVLRLRGNAGRQAAVIAGFEVAGGDRVVTLDVAARHSLATIPRLLAAMERGHDYVGGFRRRDRDGGWRWRGLVAGAVNRLRERMTGIRMTDPGSSLCAYDREVVDAVLSSDAVPVFVPALAYDYAADPAEIEVEPAPAAGRPRYSLPESILRNLDLITGFSRVPLRFFSLVGIGVATVSFVLVVLLTVWGLVVGHEVGGVFTLFGILFFLVGMVLLGIGLLGGYLGSRGRLSPGRSGYLVRESLGPRSEPADS